MAVFYASLGPDGTVMACSMVWLYSHILRLRFAALAINRSSSSSKRCIKIEDLGPWKKEAKRQDRILLSSHLKACRRYEDF